MQMPIHLEFEPEQIDALFEKLESKKLEAEDYALLKRFTQAMILITQALAKKEVSINNLKAIFGIKTESAKRIASMIGVSGSK